MENAIRLTWQIQCSFYVSFNRFRQRKQSLSKSGSPRLAGTATKEISQTENPQGFEENKKVAGRGGRIAGNARKAIEDETGRSVITSRNAMQLNHVVTQMIEASAEAAAEDEPDDDQ